MGKLALDGVPVLPLFIQQGAGHAPETMADHLTSLAYPKPSGLHYIKMDIILDNINGKCLIFQATADSIGW
jgi:hypothetical protein